MLKPEERRDQQFREELLRSIQVLTDLQVRLIEALSGLSNQLQENQKSEEYRTSSSQDPKTAEPPTIKVKAEIPETLITEHKANQKEAGSVSRWNLYASWLTFVALVIYAAFTYGQWQAALGQWGIMAVSAEQTRYALKMNAKALSLNSRQALAAESAAITARDSVNSSDKALRLDQRAYIVYESGFLSKAPDTGGKEVTPTDTIDTWLANTPLTGNITVKNIGKSPAKLVTGYSAIELSPTPDRLSMVKAAQSDFAHLRTFSSMMRKANAGGRGDVAPQQIIISSAAILETSKTTDGYEWKQVLRLRPLTIEQIKNGGYMLVVTGIVTYQDIFGDPHETDICLMFSNENPKLSLLCGTNNEIR